MLPQSRQKFLITFTITIFVIFFGCLYNKQEIIFINQDGSLFNSYSNISSFLNIIPGIPAKKKVDKISKTSSKGIAQTQNVTAKGTCGLKAFLAGNHQKVYSYTLYGSKPRYWEGLAETISSIQLLFPGWFVRVYTDFANSSFAKELSQNYSFVHICDILNLPPPKTTLKNYPKMLWRYFPLGDPQVHVVNFRDTDSQVRAFIILILWF